MKFLLSVFICCFFFGGCKKNDLAPNSPPSANDVVLITTSAVPGQIVIAKANFKPQTDTLSVFVAGTKVRAGLTDSNEIVFILPQLPQGNVTIDFKNVGVSKTAVLNVAAHTPVTQPDVILNNFNAKLDQILVYLNEHESNQNINLPDEHAEILSYLKNVQTANYSNLSAQEKIELATFIQVNMPDEATFKLDSLNDNFYSKTTGNELTPSERIWQVANQYKANVVKSVAFLAVGVALAFLPEPTLISKALAVASITRGLLDLNGAFTKMSELYNLLGIAVDIEEVNRLLNTQANEVILFKDIDKEVTIKASHRTLLASDVTSSNPFIKDIFSTRNLADNASVKAKNTLDKIKSWFGGNPAAMQVKTKNFNTTSTFRNHLLLGEGVSISGVSNSAIQLSFIRKSTTVLLRATSTTVTIETPFTFVMSYIDPYTKISVNKVVSAIYKPTSFKLGFLDGSVVPNTIIPFEKGVGKFFILLNADGTAATGIDYSKISINTNTNSLITFGLIPVTGTNGSFLLELKTNDTVKQATTFNVNYSGTNVQMVQANINAWEAEAIGEWEEKTVLFYPKNFYNNVSFLKCTLEPIKDTIINGQDYFMAVGASSIAGAFFKLDIGYKGLNTQFACETTVPLFVGPGTWSVSESGYLTGSFRHPLSFNLVKGQKNYFLYTGSVGNGILIYNRWKKLY